MPVIPQKNFFKEQSIDKIEARRQVRQLLLPKGRDQSGLEYNCSSEGGENDPDRTWLIQWLWNVRYRGFKDDFQAYHLSNLKQTIRIYLNKENRRTPNT